VGKGEIMRRLLVAAFLAVATIELAASPAMAKATKTPFSATETSAPVQEGKSWTSGHIFHIRGEVDAGTVIGDLVGTITITVNLNVDVNTGKGELFGKVSIATDAVTWSGSFAGKISGPLSSGRFGGQGTDGTRLMGRFTQTGENTFDLSGFILNPHG
jgi:hypothetical protein